jgi:fructosamine-3-kinase
MNWNSVAGALTGLGIDLDLASSPLSVGGGDINAAWQVQTSGGPLFIKAGDAESLDMFDAEARGLRELAGANAIRVPEVLGVESFDGGALLALEWLELGVISANTARLLGEQLAAQHRHTQAQHGWYRDNTIGLTLQLNKTASDWLDFYREQRLEYQLRLASDNGFAKSLQTAGQQLLDNLGVFFEGYEPAASLLHGDLWGGNWSAVNGQPVIYDPAVYYGDRETDLAMTRLFGGFPAEFYNAYSASWPLHEGHERRVGLYQLYHVLNHLNLFGGGYLGRAVSLLDDLSRD